MASAEHAPITGVWGEAPIAGAKPLVRGAERGQSPWSGTRQSRWRSPLKLKALKYLYA